MQVSEPSTRRRRASHTQVFRQLPWRPFWPSSPLDEHRSGNSIGRIYERLRRVRAAAGLVSLMVVSVAGIAMASAEPVITTAAIVQAASVIKPGLPGTAIAQDSLCSFMELGSDRPIWSRPVTRYKKLWPEPQLP